MTNKESKMFSEILNINHDLKTGKHTYDEHKKLERNLEDTIFYLKELMGEKEYEDFISAGRKMFAPKTEA